MSVFLPTQAANLGISNPNISEHKPRFHPPWFILLIGIFHHYSEPYRGIVLSALNLASIPGRLGWGSASDKLGYTSLLASSSVISAALAFLLYGFASNLGSLLSFALLFGIMVCSLFSCLFIE